MATTFFPVTANYSEFAPDQTLVGDVLFTPKGMVAGFVPASVLAKVMGGVLFQLERRIHGAAPGRALA